MKKLYFILFVFVSVNCSAQKVKEIREYIYELHLNDSISLDTVLLSFKNYSPEGRIIFEKQYQNDLNSSSFKFAKKYINDSLEIVYLQDPEIDSITSIYYHFDKHGKNLAIINHPDGDTISYKNTYRDTLIIKQECVIGCSYTKEFYYDKTNRLTSIQELFSDKTYSINWVYDKKGRIVQWSTEFGNTIISMSYKGKKSKTETYCSILDPNKCWNKIITYYDRDEKPKEKVVFANDKLYYKSFYVYNYW